MSVTKNSMVGPFFWIQGKLIAFPDKLEDGIDTGIGIIDGQAGHMAQYEKLPQRFEHDYDYWPRGRVVFDKAKNKTIVYLDRCIKNDEAVRNTIVEAYDLDPEKTSWRLDSHYKCHRCHPNYVDLVGD